MLHDPAKIQRRLRPVLVILHQERSSAGRVGQMLIEKGFSLDIRRPVLGDPLPETLVGHSGAVVFGGPMSANDNEDFVRDEIGWLSVPLKENRPYLGICLGAQMLVRQLGGRVGPRADEQVEIGWYPVEATEAGKALLPDWPSMVYHFHREGFDLPAGATCLARGDIYPNQAFRYGDKAYGVQFHAELTRAMMQRWVVHGASRFTLPNAQNGRAHLAGRMVYDAPLRDWLWRFLDLVFEEELRLYPASA
ncbi:glutamine amidotransferase [Allorhizobium sp. BGMRC 0089]|uniref:glutamine amidotransferase n=1 Tax=Allorhizobium sonneratiae TaxID=2934936 RepID=UPI002033693D|nr:glutamine amidotransferase [Allorhizobium sonneratiae]MCM2293431.1 glutamine amidotransferase [Allorhizobium sonneratiae]